MKNEISINKIIADIKATKGNRAGCHGLYSSLESDGYITSICKWTRATNPDRIDALVAEVEKLRVTLAASVEAEHVWEKTMMGVCGEDGPASVAAEISALRAQRDTALESLRNQLAAVVAENVGLRETIEAVRCIADNSSGIAGWHLNGDIAEWPEILPEIDDIETPATDRIVAGIKADGVEEFAKHCDDSIGFVEPEDEELYTLMEEQARDFAKQLREGAK